MTLLVTKDGIRFAMKTVEESRESILQHQKFIDAGGNIQWVIDADVFRFFIDPLENREYADLFQTIKYNSNENRKSLSDLAHLLADFIFSDRFTISDHLRPPLVPVVFEPHTEEVHSQIEYLLSKARGEHSDAKQAVNNNLSEKIIKLTKDYTNGANQTFKEMSVEEFKKQLFYLIDDALSILRKNSALNALKNAQELFKNRGLKYQKDLLDIHLLLNTPDAIKQLKIAGENWYSELRKQFPSPRTKEDFEKESSRAINNYRDAVVLASLEYLNQNEDETKIRYVLISGTSYLGALSKNVRKNNSKPQVHVLTPLSFLGNPFLFNIKGLQEKTNDSNDVFHDKWKRVTAALSLWSADVETSDLQNLQKDWFAIEELAKPFSLQHSSEYKLPSKQEILRNIFNGKSLDTLETQLYVAMSELFMLTANLGLKEISNETPSSTPDRKPPPLRLASYPMAEAFIQALVNRRFWSDDGTCLQNELDEQFKLLKKEAKDMGKNVGDPSFSYTILLGYAARYATLGNWHACRLMAVHARAVAVGRPNDVLTSRISGREGAFLEAYSRRLEAKSVTDLEKVKEPLSYFEKCFSIIEPSWNDVHNKNKYLNNAAINPASDQTIHSVRYKTEDICLEFSRLAFGLFIEPSDNVREKISLCFNDLSSLLNKSLLLLEGIRQINNQSVIPDSILNFLVFTQKQLELCALQCGIFMYSVSLNAIPTTIKNPALWDSVDGHKTQISRVVAAVANCLWGDQLNYKGYLSVVKNYNPHQEYPHDKGRHQFFKNILSDSR